MGSYFAGKVAIVTGGASGIGRAVGEQLLQQGARVVLADINAELIEQVAGELSAGSKPVEGAVLDVRDAAAVAELVTKTAESHGSLDLLFNNAGVASMGEVQDLTLEQWSWILDVNVRGVVHGVAAAYPLMIAQGSGQIVNTASIAGLGASPLLTPYSAAKHAVVGLSRSLRAEGGDLGVKVNVVCPGFIETPLMQSMTVVNYDRERALKEIPFKTSAAACARAILKGVRRNKAVIVVTGHGKVFAWLQRFFPWLMRWSARRSMKRFRARIRATPD